MSDSLPTTRRSSRGGRHVAPRPASSPPVPPAVHGRRAAPRPDPDVRSARRRGAPVRWAQGAVAAGLVVGVGAFALLAPSGADIAATAAQEQRERVAAAQEAAALVAHRERAVQIASTVAAQAAAA
ncbi:MAG TPA: hypothetical protein VGC04_02920, partial [Cellulomonas sp.]